MFIVSHRNVFRSRWRALLWAGGVLLTAYCTVPDEGDSDPLIGLAEQGARMAGERQRAHETPGHVNPWALDPEERH